MIWLTFCNEQRWCEEIAVNVKSFEKTTSDKRSGVYIDCSTEVVGHKTTTVMEGDEDERQPLLRNLESVARPIVEQACILDSQTNALLAEGESLSAVEATFAKMPQKKSCWKRCWCCCFCDNDDTWPDPMLLIIIYTNNYCPSSI